MEVGRGKRRRYAGCVGRDRGISGVSRAHVPFPGAGGSGRQRSLHGLSRDRDGGNGARHRRQARLVRLASVDYGVARAAGVDRRTIAERRSPSSLMPTAAAGPEIERLIGLLARLPGLGPRSARRAAPFLLKKREQIMAPLAGALATAIDKIQICRTRGHIDTQNPCTLGTDPRRDPPILVVGGDVADFW